MFVIQSKRVFLEGQFKPAQLAIDKDKIVAVEAYGKLKADHDYGNERVIPGLYDVHAHGFEGWDTCTATAEGLKNWLSKLPKEGVCGICPTTVTQATKVLEKALKNVAAVCEENPAGAEILGIHFEGPYIDEKYRGAQPKEYIVKGTVEEMKKYQEKAKGLIKIITMASEHDEDHELIRYCASNGIHVSLGHSGACFEEAIKAIKDGADSFTHVYNGMSPFNHRDNGMVGAALVCDEAYGEIICDGNHSTVNALKIFFKQKPMDKTLMISDSQLVKGLSTGTHHNFAGQEVIVAEDGSCRLVENGKLAGSTLRINEGLKLLVERVGLPFEVALASCSSNPAAYLGLSNRKGQLKAGYDADIVVLNDDYSVVQTFCRGVSCL